MNIRETITQPTTIDELRQQFLSTRKHFEVLCQPLLIEDYGLQAMPETSPAKWHLAHTSWFFEIFILKLFCPSYKAFDNSFEVLFNSYYNSVGELYPRAQRGLISRPSVDGIYHYRQHIDNAILALLDNPIAATTDFQERLILGCHHEQQHQELFFTDLKYCWRQNPQLPQYASPPPINSNMPELKFLNVEAGLYEIGANANAFHFDNEGPAHQIYLASYQMATRLISNGEYLAFIEDGGYQRAELWLADGWALLQEKKQQSQPLYWLKRAGLWYEYSLNGLEPLQLQRPVSHINAYEADAFARWSECRLPTEGEWEVFLGKYQQDRLISAKESKLVPSYDNLEIDLIGKLWQWTSSSYSPYPGFKAASGAIGEYNGKFMANQLVLRGGSCVTPAGHYRHSYRNFFYAKDQWQFTGICLAKDNHTETHNDK